MEGVADKIGELDIGARQCRWELGAGKEMGDKLGTQMQYLLMAIEGVGLLGDRCCSCKVLPKQE